MQKVYAYYILAEKSKEYFKNRILCYNKKFMNSIYFK